MRLLHDNTSAAMKLRVYLRSVSQDVFAESLQSLKVNARNATQQLSNLLEFQLK